MYHSLERIGRAVSLSEEDLRAFPRDQLHFRCHHTFSAIIIIINPMITIIIIIIFEVGAVVDACERDFSPGVTWRSHWCVSPAAPAEISNLRSNQDSSHHRGPPNKVQHSKPNSILWHPEKIDPTLPTLGWTKLQLNNEWFLHALSNSCFHLKSSR